jgi:hypothetical protein
LAVLDRVHRGVITSPFIAVTGDLVELNKLFNFYWRRIIPLGLSVWTRLMPFGWRGAAVSF